MAAVARTIYRREIEPEIRASRLLGVACELTIVNMRNGLRVSYALTDNFEKVSTPQTLNAE